MKKTISVIVAGLLAVAGCKTTPTPETVQAIASSAGLAAGYVVELTKIDDASKNAVIEIVNKVEAGKINEKQSKLVEKALNIAATGIDMLLKKNPKWAETAGLVETAITSFCEAFKTVVKPTDALAAGATQEIDVEIYRSLKSKFIK